MYDIIRQDLKIVLGVKTMEWTVIDRNSNRPNLPKENHHFYFCSPSKNSSLRPNWHNNPRGRTSYLGWLKTWQRSGEIVQDSQSNNFITKFPKMALCMGLRQRLVHQPISVVALTFNLGHCYPGPKRWLTRIAMKNVNMFVVHSRCEPEIYSRWLSLPLERFEFIPLTTPEIPITQAEETTNPFILAMGTANRDYSILLEAVKEVGIRTIVVAGRSILKRLTQIPPSVEVRSGLTLSECRNLAQQARLNIVPITNYNAASGQRTILDAMSMGRAIIATQCIGSEDYIQDGKTGILVKPNSVDDLIQAIHLLWNNPELRNSLGKAAKHYSAKHFNPDIARIALKKVLDRVENERRDEEKERV